MEDKKFGIHFIGMMLFLVGFCTLMLGLQGNTPVGYSEPEQPMCGEYWCK